MGTIKAPNVAQLSAARRQAGHTRMLHTSSKNETTAAASSRVSVAAAARAPPSTALRRLESTGTRVSKASP
jgi:hypothetical protein